MEWLIYGLVFLGSALMIFNIIGFIRFASYIKKTESWDGKNVILYVPIVLLVFFFLGYLAVGIFGNPDIVVSLILFGGSVFVFIIYLLLNSITKRVMEHERREAELMAAEQSTQIKSTFLASISHEMRTPMNVILGLVRKSYSDKNIPQETKEVMRKIHDSAEMLNIQINNMLDLNEIASGSLEVKNAEFELSGMLGRINDIAKILCENHNLEYHTIVGDGACCRYYGDEMLLAQVILGILDNATKYTNPPGSVTFFTGCIDADENTRTLKFAVTDTGIGIDEEFIPKLFELFSQEDSSSTNPFGGSGTGLAVAKSRIGLLGGRIEVESRKNEGSTFTIIVPLTIAGSSKASEDKAGEERIDEVSLEGKKVLIVEDIPENAEIVMDLLEIEGVETVHAQNGKIAIQMFSDAPEFYYDAVLMDLRMPIVDGLEAAKAIRALDRKDAKITPILALTANAFESDRKQTEAAGMNAHLTKPIDVDVLYLNLKRFISETEEKKKGL